MLLSDKTYGFLKNLVQVVLPAFATFYLALSGLWGLPASLQVGGTITALSAFLGVLLKISSSQYKELKATEPLKNAIGHLVVTEGSDGKKTASLEFAEEVEDVLEMDSITLQVVKAPPKKTPARKAAARKK